MDNQGIWANIYNEKMWKEFCHNMNKINFVFNDISIALQSTDSKVFLPSIFLYREFDQLNNTNNA